MPLNKLLGTELYISVNIIIIIIIMEHLVYSPSSVKVNMAEENYRITTQTMYQTSHWYYSLKPKVFYNK